MAYIVQALSRDDPGNAVSVTLADRKEALAAGNAWMSRGFTSIRVIGDGQVYMLIEFALTIPEE